MAAAYSQLTEELYRLINQLPRFNHLTPRERLPDNAVYLFFERGEVALQPSGSVDRIVRVGAHQKNGNFRQRIRQHYGLVNSFGGNKNGSVFRKHVGGALLRRDDQDDWRLPEWLKQMGQSYPEVEEMVSRELRANFTFACIQVDDQAERLALESGIIALLAQYRLGQPSQTWLGRLAQSDKVRATGLWNEHHVDRTPLSAAQLLRLRALAQVREGV